MKKHRFNNGNSLLSFQLNGALAGKHKAWNNISQKCGAKIFDIIRKGGGAFFQPLVLR